MPNFRLFRNHRRWSLIAFGIIILVLAVIWFSIQPSNDRDWADDVAYNVTGDVSGDRVTLYHVRNFKWRGLEDYDPQWETRHYDLAQLASVDLFLSSWGRPSIAHTLISFGFNDGSFVTFSVEIRREKGEKFSEVAGFFKQYEIALIAADERDIIFTRTNIRKENVFRYPVALSPEQRRSLFLSYVERGNSLATKPVFYNTVTANCTTVVFDMIRQIVPSIPLDYRIFLSGYLPSYIYGLGGFGKDVSLEELNAKAPISEHAQKIKDIENYSVWIR